MTKYSQYIENGLVWDGDIWIQVLVTHSLAVWHWLRHPILTSSGAKRWRPGPDCTNPVLLPAAHAIAALGCSPPSSLCKMVLKLTLKCCVSVAFLHFRILISYGDLYCDILIVSQLKTRRRRECKNFDLKNNYCVIISFRSGEKNEQLSQSYTWGFLNNSYFASKLELFKIVN